MKSTGVVRKIDNLGRIVIPKEIRDVNGWEPGTSMEMFSEEKGLVIRQFESSYENQTLINELESILEYEDRNTAYAAIEKAIIKLQKGG